MGGIVLLLSGGMDSVTLLHHVVARGDRPECLTITYGQLSMPKELKSSEYWAGRFGLRHTVVDIRGALVGSALLGDKPMPTGPYSLDRMKSTVVPNRNMVLLSIAIGRALSWGIGSVAYAAHAGDAQVYPDCSPQFVEAMKTAAAACDWNPISIETPFLGMSKSQIASRAAELGVDIGLTWSCYSGGDSPCEECGACISRAKALRQC